MSNSTNIIRIACDLSLPNRAPINVIDGLQVSINRGKAYCIEIGLYDKEVWQENIAQFVSVNLQVRLTRTSAAIIDVTTAVPVLTVPLSSWEDRTAQHLQIQITSAQTAALSVPTPFQLAHWVAISGTTAGGAVVTFAAGELTAVEDGAQVSGSTPVSGDPNYLTAAQVVTMIQSAISNHSITSNGFVFIPGVDTDGIVTWSVRLA